MSASARNGLPWSPDEIRRLRELAAAGRTSAEVAEALERTRVGVRSKAMSLGVVLVAARKRSVRKLTTHDR